MSMEAEALAAPHPRVRGALERHGIAARVHVHRLLAPAIMSPADVAEALGYEQARIAKSLFLRRRGGGEFVVAVAPVTGRLDLAAVAAAAGAPPLELARPEELAAVAGYGVGGVSPLAAPAGVPVVVDDSLLSHETILVGAGRAGVELELEPAELVAATAARVA